MPQRTSVVVPPSGPPVVPTDAELQDLAMMAQDEGISLNQAISRYGWQREFEKAVQRLRNAYPNGYASSNMNVSGTISAQILMTGVVPGDIADYISGVPVPVEVVGGTNYSEQQVQQFVESTHYATRESTSNPHVSTEYDEVEGRIVATVYTDDDVRTGHLSSRATSRVVYARVQRRVGADSSTPPPPVVIVYAPERASGTDTIRGGAILTFPGSTSLACTSGWPVKSTNSSLEGLITADHCPNDMEYSGRDVLTYRTRTISNHGDIQAMSSTEDVGHTYYYGVGEYRDIDGIGTPTNDQYLCKFGRSSGRTCDRVRDTFTCRDSYCNLVSMDNREAAGGDSGGPWGYGATAYGVHSGYHTSLFQRRDQWTPVYNTLADMSVKIKMGRN